MARSRYRFYSLVFVSYRLLARWRRDTKLININGIKMLPCNNLYIYTDALWRAFWPIASTHVQKLRLSNKFEVWVSCVHCSTLRRFFCLIFQNGIQPLARFTEYRIYNNWKWFGLWWGTNEAKICRFPAFIDEIDKMVMFT